MIARAAYDHARHSARRMGHLGVSTSAAASPIFNVKLR
jgi:hypothetical protein